MDVERALGSCAWTLFFESLLMPNLYCVSQHVEHVLPDRVGRTRAIWWCAFLQRGLARIGLWLSLRSDLPGRGVARYGAFLAACWAYFLMYHLVWTTYYVRDRDYAFAGKIQAFGMACAALAVVASPTRAIAATFSLSLLATIALRRALDEPDLGAELARRVARDVAAIPIGRTR